MNSPSSPAPVFGPYDQAALDAQYDQRTLVPDIESYVTRWREESERLRRVLDCHCDVAYGDDPVERLDFFPSGQDGSPIVAFIHGGAWTRQSRSESAYPAAAVVESGACFAVIGSARVPGVCLETQVDQNLRAIAWLYRHAAALGGDPRRIYLVGHSSGGHITGLAITEDWTRFDMPAEAIKGAMAVSGIYDLEPVRLSARNDYLGLDAERARAMSPIHRVARAGCPLVIAWGGRELEEFQRQSREFADAWKAGGHECTALALQGCNHFDLTYELMTPQGRLMPRLFEIMVR